MNVYVPSLASHPCKHEDVATPAQYLPQKLQSMKNVEAPHIRFDKFSGYPLLAPVTQTPVQNHDALV